MGPWLIILGALMLTASVRDKQDALYAMWGDQFRGDGNRPGFGAIALAVGGSAALGFAPGLRNISNVLTFTIVLGIIAANIETQNNPFRRLEGFVLNKGSASPPPSLLTPSSAIGDTDNEAPLDRGPNTAQGPSRNEPASANVTEEWYAREEERAARIFGRLGRRN